MPVEMTVEGDAFKALQRKLKAVDRRDLRRELNRGLRDGAKPLIGDARDAARSELPSTGGLADRVAGKPMSISITQAGVQVRIKGVDAVSTNRGRLRHPVYGNREVWVTQSIKPGWFTDRMRREAPKVRPDLVRAMERVAEKIADA
jgi:hypothetical protein